MATVTPVTSVPAATRGSGVKYPHPWFDVASTLLPPSINMLMKWCRYYGTVHPISGVIRKMSEYPITDLIIEHESLEVKNTYGGILFDSLNIKAQLISMGMDYYSFGNSFVSLQLPFTRYLTCTKCHKKMAAKKLDYRFDDYKFKAHCKTCKTETTWKIIDIPLQNKNKLSLVRWDPEQVEIKYNPITNHSMFLYRIPAGIKSNIKKGERFTLEDTPELFLRAVKKNLQVEFTGSRLFHFKRPSIAGKDMGWGEPIIQPVLKYLFYLQILMKAREASAQQGINPLRVLYPSSNSGFNAYENLNLAKWRTRIESEITAWRQDPNRISVMPIPVGYELIGGEHKGVDTTPEVQQLMDDIIAGMQIPKSFYYGGSAYSGTSAEFRMLENHFLNFQKQCLQFLNGYLIPILSKLFDLPKVTVKFADLKMADDVQKKQLLLNLNTQRPKKISDGTLMAEFNLNPESERKIIAEERKQDLEDGVQELEDQAEAQGRSARISMRHQVKNQMIAQIERQRITKELVLEGYTVEEIGSAFGQQYAPGEEPVEQGDPANLGPSEQEVTNLKQVLADMPPDQKDKTLKKLETENPTLFAAVMGQGEQPQGGDLGREAGQLDTRPLPEQRPPTRTNSTL